LPARFHAHTHLLLLCRQVTVEFLRFLAVLQSPLLQFPSLGIYKNNLLKARVVICTYNQHIGSFSPEPFWLVCATKVYSGLGADIIMESILLVGHGVAPKSGLWETVSHGKDEVHASGSVASYRHAKAAHSQRRPKKV